MNFIPRSKLIIFGFALIIGLIFLVALVISIFKPESEVKPKPSMLPALPAKQGAPIVIPEINTTQQPSFKSYLDTVIGETTTEQIANLPDIVNKQSLPNGNLIFEFSSTDPLRNNLIETESGKAVFKRVGSVTSGDYKTPAVKTYFDAYGAPEAEFTGSNRHGPYAKTFVFPSKGFALIVNPYTSEVYEIQSFMPVSLDVYRNRWGQDINENIPLEENVGI